MVKNKESIYYWHLSRTEVNLIVEKKLSEEFSSIKKELDRMREEIADLSVRRR